MHGTQRNCPHQRYYRNATSCILRRALLCSIVLFVVIAAVRDASADRIPVNLPARVVIGPPHGFCAMARVDGRRTGMVEELPSKPKELWQVSAPGDVHVSVAVGDAGAVVVATDSAWLAQFDGKGRKQWQRQLDGAAASTGPVIMSDGTRLVLTAIAHAWGFDSKGELRFRTDISRFGTNPRTSPLPTEHGSVVVAIGTNLVVLDQAGSVMMHVDVGQRLMGGVVSEGRGVIVTTEGGDVIRWVSPLPPRRIGSFKGKLRAGAASSGGGSLLAVVDSARLVSMDLSTGLTTTILSANGLEGTPTIDGKGWFHVASVANNAVASATNNADVLLTASHAGLERRSNLDTPSETALDPAVAGVLLSVPTSPNRPMLADKAGRVLFARPGGVIGVVSPDGHVHYASESSCATPVDIAPSGRRLFVVACENGEVLQYGQ